MLKCILESVGFASLTAEPARPALPRLHRSLPYPPQPLQHAPSLIALHSPPPPPNRAPTALACIIAPAAFPTAPHIVLTPLAGKAV